MRCTCCKKKSSVILTCNYCPHDLCVKCRGFEAHRCDGVHVKREVELKVLDKKLEYKIVKHNELLHT